MNAKLNERRDYIHDQLIDTLSSQSIYGNELIELVADSVDSNFPLIADAEKIQIAQSVVDEVRGYGFLEDFLKDSEVNEIMVNSSSAGFIDRSGAIEPIAIDLSEDELLRLIQKIASSVGARCDMASPILDAWLRDGSRVHCVLPPIAANGPYLTIRRFISQTYDLENFCINELQVSLVRQLVSEAKNIVVAGGTSSGKTTLLSSLINQVDHNQRIVAIEETSELTSEHPHVVKLLARSSNSEGAGQITVGELVKASLRMRPDRIVVGEVRSEEAFDLVQALNTGHDGSLCTIHANGPAEVIHRMASLAMFAHPGLDYQAIVNQICFGIDCIIYVKKNRQGRRYVDSISEIKRSSGSVSVFNMETLESVNV